MWLKRFLILLGSELWSLGSALTRVLVRFHILRPVKLPERVISVGNIQVGGAGKTPLVARIARDAHERGYQAWILTRGYGGLWERTGGVISPQGQIPLTKDCGDEAALLHDLVPHAWIGVGADRVRSFWNIQNQVAEQNRVLVLLDDGFQYRGLYKDVEIVAVTSLGRQEVLFRDGSRSLKGADLLVWTKGEVFPQTPRMPEVRVRFRLNPATSVQEVWLVTGLADARSVLESVKQAGFRVIRSLSFPDHAHYSGDQIRTLLQDAAREGCKIAITGKDWVKWREHGVQFSELIVLEPEVVFEKGQSLWNRCIWKE